MNPKREGEDPAALLTAGMQQVARGRLDTNIGEWPDEPYRSLFREFNEMSKSLLNTEALQESFVSNVAHEFKMPLSYIQGYASMLQSDGLTPSERNSYIQRLIEATTHMAQTVGNLLEISNLSRPSAGLRTKTYSLDEQLRHVMAMFIPVIERESLRYDVDFEAVDIDGNPSLLEDVWVNLISNAVKYTQAGGKVIVTLHRSGDNALVTVVDSGQGMNEEQVKHAFDRFYKGSSDKQVEGSGLGLAIVHAVVKKHHGTVRVTSEVGVGSAFTVTLPLHQPE